MINTSVWNELIRILIELNNTDVRKYFAEFDYEVTRKGIRIIEFDLYGTVPISPIVSFRGSDAPWINGNSIATSIFLLKAMMNDINSKIEIIDPVFSEDKLTVVQDNKSIILHSKEYGVQSINSDGITTTLDDNQYQVIEEIVPLKLSPKEVYSTIEIDDIRLECERA